MKTAIEILAKKFPGSYPEEQLMKELPHGSGIDSTWSVDVAKNGNVTYYNNYHAMDEWGGYDGWGDFRIVLFVHKKTVLHALKGPSTGMYQVIHKRGDLDWRMYTRFPRRNSFYGLRGMLGDMFADFFSCANWNQPPGVDTAAYNTLTKKEAAKMLKEKHVVVK